VAQSAERPTPDFGCHDLRVGRSKPLVGLRAGRGACLRLSLRLLPTPQIKKIKQKDKSLTISKLPRHYIHLGPNSSDLVSLLDGVWLPPGQVEVVTGHTEQAIRTAKQGQSKHQSQRPPDATAYIPPFSDHLGLSRVRQCPPMNHLKKLFFFFSDDLNILSTCAR